nr:TIMELESS-interacting protein-like isoform X2 [Crassostrea virginica]
MESVDLDMGEIFEEGEEDFPSVNPLPDLPQDDEAGEGVGFPEDGEENSAEVLSRLKDLSKGAAKKVVRRIQPKLDATRLTGDRGIPILPKVFQDVKFKGKGHEARDLQVIMRYLEHWAHRLFPKMPFDEVLERIEKLGTKNEVKTCIKRMRLDMPILNSEFVGEEKEEEEKEMADIQDPEDIDLDAEEALEEMKAEEKKNSPTRGNGDSPPKAGGMLAAQLSQPLSTIPSSSSSDSFTPRFSSPGISRDLTQEQRERLERNRQLALEKRANKQLGAGQHVFKTPAIPKSPARRLVSHTVSSPSQESSPILQSPPKMCNHGNIPIMNTGNQPTFHSLVTASSSQSSPVKSTAGSNLTNGSHPIRDSVTSQDSKMSEVIPFINENNPLGSSEMSQTIPHLTSPQRKSSAINNRAADLNTSSDQLSEEELLLHLSESD